MDRRNGEISLLASPYKGLNPFHQAEQTKQADMAQETSIMTSFRVEHRQCGEFHKRLSSMQRCLKDGIG